MSDGESLGAATFTVLGSRVREALSERGFSTPTEPQRLAIPPIAAGEHTLVIAPTGTGKTETAMLPVFDAIVERREEARERDEEVLQGISTLYITPLRALNRDMRDRLEWWGETLDLDVDVRHGDTTRYRRRQQALNPPDVLVTTPETLQAMFTGSRLREALSGVEHVVVDEVHELAASKRGAQLSIALERLLELTGPFQRIGLSATVGDPAAVGRFLTADRGCSIAEVDAGSRLSLTVRRPEITDEDEELSGKLMTDATTSSHVRAIRDLVAAHESTLIFVNTRQTAEALGSRFTELDLPIGVHHGSLSKAARVDVEDRFKAGELDALLCTSSMELGIDVGRIDHVIQYASPRQVARLLQRVGRAGHRADRTSRGTILTRHADDTFEALAICRRALDGRVEAADIHEGSLDVVANQVPGIVQDTRGCSVAHLHEVVSRAYPFRDLSLEELSSILRELRRNRIVWLEADSPEAPIGQDGASTEGSGHEQGAGRAIPDEGPLPAYVHVESSSGTRQYVYSNLSMIPDEETYEVHDVASGSQIGTLDERFVVNFAAPGAVFIQRGEMWRIAEVNDEEARVKVTPIEDPAGEVPSWIGQEIPVPYAVAQEVGELRDVAGEQLAAGGDPSSVAHDVLGRYPSDEHTVSDALEQVAEHVDEEAPLPTADRIVVEQAGGKIVVNACVGHKANETLGRVLSSLLGQRSGSSIGLDVDPYRIELDVPGSVSRGDVVEVLESTDPEHVETIIELSLKHSEALAFRLVQVAESFGALKRWQGSGRVSASRLLAAFEDTPIYAEAVREVFHEDLAVEEAAAVLTAIQSGDVDVISVRGRTPVGRGGHSTKRELLAPENADASVVETVRERIQNDRVILLCTHCKEWRAKTKVRRVPDQPQCPECGSTRIAALNPWDDDTVAAVRASEKDAEQERLTRRAYRSASLVQSHGKRAVIALAARGVGPHNAARIINRLRENEDDFYRDILEREREYARTQSFWG